MVIDVPVTRAHIQLVHIKFQVYFNWFAILEDCADTSSRRADTSSESEKNQIFFKQNLTFFEKPSAVNVLTLWKIF